MAEKVKNQTEEQKEMNEKKKRDMSLSVALQRLKKSLYTAIDTYQREKKISSEKAVERVDTFLAKAYDSREKDKELAATIAALREKYGDSLIIKSKRATIE